MPAEETVAEGAFTLMLALAKKLMPLQRAKLEGRPVQVRSQDPRLRAQEAGVMFVG